MIMKINARKWFGLAVLVGFGLGASGSRAEAQFFGFSYNSPGLSIGVNQPAYYGGGYYPPPVVVAPPVIVAPQPYYPGTYGPRGGYYGGYRGGSYGGHHGGYPGGHHGYPGGHHGYSGGGYGPRRPYY